MIAPDPTRHATDHLCDVVAGSTLLDCQRRQINEISAGLLRGLHSHPGLEEGVKIMALWRALAFAYAYRAVALKVGPDEAASALCAAAIPASNMAEAETCRMLAEREAREGIGATNVYPWRAP